MAAFEYPGHQHVRRHGPSGYREYASYRDWLRDEFMFRCVYCLLREQWNTGGTLFHIDHLIPVSECFDLRCEYTNLLYACSTCNEAKNNVLGVPDPCKIAFDSCLRIMDDGRFQALNQNGEILEQILHLNLKSRVQYRRRWMKTLEILKKEHPALYNEYMGFPSDLPDLRKKSVPRNTKPEGVQNCSFALRERGQLPLTY